MQGVTPLAWLLQDHLNNFNSPESPIRTNMIFTKGFCLAIVIFIVTGVDAAALYDFSSLSDTNSGDDKRLCSSKENLRERTLTFDFGGVQVRGVNLGGWLVAERKPS